MTRASETCEQVVIADAFHRTSQRGAIPYAKELDATRPAALGLDATRLAEREQGVIQLWERELDATPPAALGLDATRLAEREQGAIQPEEQVPGVIQLWEREQGETQPAELEQDATLFELEQDETRCELLGVIPYGPELKAVSRFLEQHAFRFAPEQRCEFPSAVPFLQQDATRFSSLGA